jgi:hypothetical protein
MERSFDPESRMKSNLDKRCRTETAKAVSGRVLGPNCLDTDEVRIKLDWTPSITHGRIVFHISVLRRGIQSSSNCEIDLGCLDPLQIERLHNFLSLRHAGVTSAADVTREVAWLLDISLCQARPELNKSDRDLRVRELLLVHQNVGRQSPNDRKL